MSPEVQRKLTTILAADAEGYSRVMEADEVGTLARFLMLWTAHPPASRLPLMAQSGSANGVLRLPLSGA